MKHAFRQLLTLLVMALPLALAAQYALPTTAERPVKALAPELTAPLTPAAAAAGSQFHWVAVVAASVVGVALLLSSLSLLLAYRISWASKGKPSLRRDPPDSPQEAPSLAPKAILYEGMDLSGRTGGNAYDITSEAILIGRDPGAGGSPSRMRVLAPSACGDRVSRSHLHLLAD